MSRQLYCDLCLATGSWRICRWPQFFWGWLVVRMIGSASIGRKVKCSLKSSGNEVKAKKKNWSSSKDATAIVSTPPTLTGRLVPCVLRSYPGLEYFSPSPSSVFSSFKINKYQRNRKNKKKYGKLHQGNRSRVFDLTPFLLPLSTSSIALFIFVLPFLFISTGKNKNDRFFRRYGHFLYVRNLPTSRWMNSWRTFKRMGQHRPKSGPVCIKGAESWCALIRLYQLKCRYSQVLRLRARQKDWTGSGQQRDP